MNPRHIEIYTDGSCHTQQKNGAWAAIIFIEGIKTTLTGIEKNTTHNRMELLAVIKAIEFVDKKEWNAPLVVYTDSQYVFDIPQRTNKLKEKKFLTNKGNQIQNAELVQTLIQQIESHTIQFIKVTAHKKTDTESSKYNSQVDKISRSLVRKQI